MHIATVLLIESLSEFSLVVLLEAFVAAFAVIYTYFKQSLNYFQKRNVIVAFEPTFHWSNFASPFSKEKGVLDVVVKAYEEPKKSAIQWFLFSIHIYKYYH